MMGQRQAKNNPLVAFLSHYDDTYTHAAEAVGTHRTTILRWQEKGFIPERYALDVHALGIGIDVMDILKAAKRQRKRQ